MSDQTVLSLPSSVVARLSAAADELDIPVELLLDGLLDQGVSFEYDGLGGGSRLVTAASAPSTIGVYFDAESECDGVPDHDAQVRATTEFSALLRDHGIDGRVVLRDFDIGRGAQGDPVTMLQIISAVFAVAAAPAVAVNAWATAIPKIQEWLRQRNGCMTLEFVKACCLEDAKQRVQRPEDLSLNLVSGHRGTALTTRFDIESVGPYCVTVIVPERSSAFVYVTDDVGQILHFIEAPGPSEETVISDENR